MNHSDQLLRTDFALGLSAFQLPVAAALVKGLRKSNFLLFTNNLKLSAKQMFKHYAARFQLEITLGYLRK